MNSTSGGFAYISKNKWVITAIKTDTSVKYKQKVTLRIKFWPFFSVGAKEFKIQIYECNIVGKLEFF